MAYKKSCDECGAEFTARNNNHRFCTDDCRKNFWSNQEVEKTCAVCNTVFTAGFKVKACSKECSKIMNVVENQHARNDTLTDDDIIYLIMLNPGIGLKRFDKEVQKWRKCKKKTNHKFQVRVFDICQFYKEDRGFDLYDLLQDATYMEKVTLNEYLNKTGADRLPQGQGISSGNRTALKKYKNNPNQYTRQNSRRVKVDLREFNWGKFAQSED